MFEQPILVCDQYESSRPRDTCDTLPPPTLLLCRAEMFQNVRKADVREFRCGEKKKGVFAAGDVLAVMFFGDVDPAEASTTTEADCL